MTEKVALVSKKSQSQDNFINDDSQIKFFLILVVKYFC